MRCGMSSRDNENKKCKRNLSWDLVGPENVQHQVEIRQTTILGRPGEDLEQRVRQTQEKFARKGISIPASGEEFDGHKTSRDSVIL
jgi:hypothetical protein